MGGTTKKLSLTQTIQYWINKCRKQWEDMDQGECTLHGNCRRIPTQGVIVELQMGGSKGRTLHIYPDFAVTKEATTQLQPDLLILDPAHFFSRPEGFLRLTAGQGVVLGRHDAHQSRCFQYPSYVASRHITLIHQGTHLLIKDLKTDHGSLLRLINQAEFVQRISQRRLHQLHQLMTLYGSAFQPLSHDSALERLQQAHKNLHLSCWATVQSIQASETQWVPCPPVIRLSSLTIPVIVGDLHGRIDNLLTLLTVGGCLKGLKNNKTTLIFLGDAVHLDEGKNLADMTSSMVMMDLILTLMNQFPGQIVYLRGNHDGFSEEISKGGISQGQAWSQALLQHRGEAYRNAMQAFYQDLPYVVAHPCFISCHAGPPIDSIDATALLNLRQHPKLMRQLIWSRAAKANRTTGYTAKHVQKFREAMQVHKETPLVVGHDLIDHNNTIWLNAGQIDNHHVLYGSHPERIGWITFVEGELLALEYPVEPLLQLAQSLPDETT